MHILRKKKSPKNDVAAGTCWRAVKEASQRSSSSRRDHSTGNDAKLCGKVLMKGAKADCSPSCISARKASASTN